MSLTDLEQRVARDPLAERLSRVRFEAAPEDLRARILTGARASGSGGGRRRRPFLIAAVAVAVLAVVLTVTPVGAAIGRAVLPRGLQQFFGLVSGTPATLHRPTASECAIFDGAPDMTTTTFTANGLTITRRTRTCADGRTITGYAYQQALLALDDAQGDVGFRIRTAAAVPAALHLAGVGLTPQPPDFTTYADEASVTYRPATGTGSLAIDERPGAAVGGSGVPSNAVRHTAVGGAPAVYARGTYESAGGASATWNPSADVEELSWAADGITFDLTATGLHLTEGDLVAIAASVR